MAAPAGPPPAAAATHDHLMRLRGVYGHSLSADAQESLPSLRSDDDAVPIG